MRHISESIIGRKGVGATPVFHRIKNPSYSDMIPWNIVRTKDVYDNAEYGIIVSSEVAKKLFHSYDSRYNAIVFYNPRCGWLEELEVSVFRSRFPDSSIDYRICDIWTGEKSYFENRLLEPDNFIEFLRPAYENPKEFERMLKP